MARFQPQARTRYHRNSSSGPREKTLFSKSKDIMKKQKMLWLVGVSLLIAVTIGAQEKQSRREPMTSRWSASTEIALC